MRSVGRRENIIKIYIEVIRVCDYGRDLAASG